MEAMLDIEECSNPSKGQSW